MSANANSGATHEPAPKRRRRTTAIDLSGDDDQFRARYASDMAALHDIIGDLTRRLRAVEQQQQHSSTAGAVPMAVAVEDEDGAAAAPAPAHDFGSDTETEADSQSQSQSQSQGAGAGVQDDLKNIPGTLDSCLADIVEHVPVDMPPWGNFRFTFDGPDEACATTPKWTTDDNRDMSDEAQDAMLDVYGHIMDTNAATDILQGQSGGRFDEDDEEAGDCVGIITLRVDFTRGALCEDNLPFVATIEFEEE